MVFFIFRIGPRQNLVRVYRIIANQQEYNPNKCEKSAFSGLKNVKLMKSIIEQPIDDFGSLAYVFENQTVVHLTISYSFIILSLISWKLIK